MRFTRYDIWKVLLGICIAMWVLQFDWKLSLASSIFTAFLYGWSSVYCPNDKGDDYYLPEDQPEKGKGR